MKIFFLFCAIIFIGRINGQVPAFIKKYSLQNILQSDTATWKEFLNTETMRAGVYKLADDNTDSTVTEKEDGVYYILKGKAVLQIEGKSYVADTGSIFFIKSGMQRQFTKSGNDLLMLEIFSKATSNKPDTNFAEYAMNELEQKRRADENTWNPFIRYTSLIFGLYMLPAKAGGDNTLTHQVDELNYVTKGEGKFTVDDYTMDVRKDDIIFVEKGHGHYFHDLQNDFDVLIFWEKKSLIQ